MFLSFVFIFGVICSSKTAVIREEVRALPPHMLSKFDPIPSDFETAWTAFKKQNGLDYTKKTDEEVKRKALFKTTYDMVMDVNLDPKSTYTLTMYYPHSIETAGEKAKPMPQSMIEQYNAFINANHSSSDNNNGAYKM